MSSPSNPATEINTTFEALGNDFPSGVCYIANGSPVYIADYEVDGLMWEMGSTIPTISIGGTTPVLGLVYNNDTTAREWALHGNITGNDGDTLSFDVTYSEDPVGTYTFIIVATPTPFPDAGTPEDPIESLTITGADLAKGVVARTFYLTQGATLDITGWFNDGSEYWFDRNDPEPGHNIVRTNILNDNDQWEGYRFTSSGVTNVNPAMTETFYLTYHMRDLTAGTTTTYTWSFSIMADPDADDESSTPTVNRGEGVDIQREEQIFMSDIDNLSQYLIYQSESDYNCVESYTIYGGSEQPFEYVKLKINRKQLSVLAPELIDYIIPGRNIITLFGPGRGEYVVTKCSKSNDTWTVVAYATMEQIRGLVITESRSFTELAPADMITNLVRSTPDMLAVSGSNPLNLIHEIAFLVRASNNSWANPVGCAFEAGTNVWYAIQVCALKLNAKVWLTDGVLYVIDTSLTAQEALNPSTTFSSLGQSKSPFNDIGTIYLNSEGGFPINPTEYQQDIISNVVDTPELGEDGSEVLRNTVTITYKGNMTTMSDNNGNPANSRSIYNMKMHSLTIPQISEGDAKAIANLMANKYCDSETSISFSMAEIVESTETEDGVTTTHFRWYPFFTPLTRAEKIVDYVNESTTSITSNLDLTSKFYNKGMLSLYESSFPQHITKYTFGISMPTDVSQNNSIILSAINNG